MSERQIFLTYIFDNAFFRRKNFLDFCKIANWNDRLVIVHNIRTFMLDDSCTNIELWNLINLLILTYINQLETKSFKIVCKNELKI